VGRGQERLGGCGTYTAGWGRFGVLERRWRGETASQLIVFSSLGTSDLAPFSASLYLLLPLRAKAEWSRMYIHLSILGIICPFIPGVLYL
jgi:hypothetical protein